MFCFCRIIVMGTSEKLGVNIHVDQLMDAIASNCANLERLELRYEDMDELIRQRWLEQNGWIFVTDGIRKICVSLTKVRKQSICFVSNVLNWDVWCWGKIFLKQKQKKNSQYSQFFGGRCSFYSIWDFEPIPTYTHCYLMPIH